MKSIAFLNHIVIHLSVSGQLGWFYFLTIANRVAMSMPVSLRQCMVWGAVSRSHKFVPRGISAFSCSKHLSIGFHRSCTSNIFIESVRASLCSNPRQGLLSFLFSSWLVWDDDPKVVLFVFFLRVGMLNMFFKIIYTYQCFIFSFWTLSIQCHF